MKNVWTRWKRIAKIAANIQANILLSVVYFLIMVPVSVIFKTLILFKNEKKSSSYWSTRRKIIQNMDWAKRQ